MRKWLKKCTPPGIPLRGELSFLLLGNLCALLLSFGFLANYHTARMSLFDFIGGKRVLIEEAQIADFTELIHRTLWGFAVVALAMSGMILYHYFYYRQGSKSIYLMKRLPNPWERHLRALALPLAAILATVLLAVLIRFLYFVLYLLATPKECLPPQVWQQLWRLP